MLRNGDAHGEVGRAFRIRQRNTVEGSVREHLAKLRLRLKRTSLAPGGKRCSKACVRKLFLSTLDGGRGHERLMHGDRRGPLTNQRVAQRSASPSEKRSWSGTIVRSRA